MVYLVLLWVSEMCQYIFACSKTDASLGPLAHFFLEKFLNYLSRQKEGSLCGKVYIILVRLVLVHIYPSMVQLSTLTVDSAFYVLLDLPIGTNIHIGST